MSLIDISPPSFDLVIALAYATPDNITGKPIYARAGCYLHEKAAERLQAAIALAAPLGLRFKVFDAYRPVLPATLSLSRTGPGWPRSIGFRRRTISLRKRPCRGGS